MYVSGEQIHLASNGNNWSEPILPMHCLPYKGHSSVRWILGTLFCAGWWFLLTRPEESGNVNIPHYARLSTQREHTQWTILVLFSLSICLSRTFPPILPLFLLFFVTLYSQFSRLLFRSPELAKNIVVIKLVGLRSEQLIEKSSTGLLQSEWKAKPKCFFYELDHKPCCVCVI